MFLKRKLTIMTTVALLSTSLLAGCSNKSEEGSDTGSGVATTSDKVLANINAREAIARSIDKQALCDIILNNGSIPTDRYTASGLAFDNGKDYADLTKGMGYGYDEALAQEAWTKAKEEVGFDTVEIEILTYDSEGGKRTAEFIQGELSDLEGLQVTIVNLPFEQKLEKEATGDFDIAFSSWGADYPDPLTFLKTMEPGNEVKYDNEEYNNLVKEGQTLPLSESFAKYAQAEQIMLEDAYMAPLYQKGKSFLIKEDVKGIIEHSWGAEFTYKLADVDRDEKVLNLTNASDIPTLDVSKATDSVSIGVLNNIMEGLTRTDENGKLLPGIAESWETSEDGLTWTFNLRKDSSWSNGDPVTAKDFEYSIKRTLDPNTASEYAYIMEDIVGASDVSEKGLDNIGVTALDDYTLEIKLNRPVAYFGELMSFPLFFPQNQSFVESCGDKYGTTLEYQLYNGPFTLASWKMEDQYAMAKNPNYWDSASVKLETINTKIVKETGAAVNLYEDGQIDRVELSSDYVDKYKDSSEFKTKQDASVNILLINAEKNK